MMEAPEPVSGVETVPSNEAEQIREIADLIVKLIEQRHQDGNPIRRGVHPKAHGCARATFTVKPGLPKDRSVGVFANGGVSFDAVVRFSNADVLAGRDVTDVVKDGVTTRQHGSRGMAVKVRGLPGTSLTPDEPGTQDFLMVNSNVFPFANVADYLLLTKVQLELHDQGPVVQTFAQRLAASGGGLRAQKVGKIGMEIQKAAMSNPVSSSYFSAAPFMFGADRVMKFSARPSSGIPEAPLPESLDADYLRAALAETLRSRAVSFEFLVQVRPPSPEAQVEDVTVPWEDVPFESVATIDIPQQDIDAPDNAARCESLFWTPWHALSEHRPVGGINRLRLAVYESSVARRRQAAV